MKYLQKIHVTGSVKWALAGALALALVACGFGDDSLPTSTTTVLAASLSGDQEVPPTITGALGTGTLSLVSPSRAISGSITLDGMTATEAHIHVGDTGFNGPIIVPLTQTAPGTWSVPAGATLTESQATAFAAGGLYYNAHSVANPGGEIRGQIGREVFAAQMSAAQEVPPNASAATGNGLLSFDPTTKKFSARHLDGPGRQRSAYSYRNNRHQRRDPFGLTETAPASGIWVSAPDATLTDAQLATLKAGGLYFNAHSVAFPGGEVRGQIARNVRFMSLSGAQEVPPNASLATGTGTLVIDPANRAASGSITLSGMTANAAHIHLAAAGVNGPIIVPLTNAGGGNVWAVPANTVLSADQLRAYKQGDLYYNAHSIAFPNGEIRGQIR
ncbi:CHRD domain-containing protein [Polaromonas sp. P1(28)-13]|nr:CHRD domain-containing protein [Polaromonas sp. P1(28)-13]